MNPTPEYLSASDVTRSREEISRDAIHVVVENYHEVENPIGKSMVYLSVDNGVSFVLLTWEVSWLGRLKSLAREWPPHDVHVEKLDDDALHLGYCEATYDGPVDYKASYLFEKKGWQI